ncbi:MAG: hypothetical protein KF901_13745 [Myxococcales bacterium]|nr:hypothetical protein [Myxococcales bacterium]
MTKNAMCVIALSLLAIGSTGCGDSTPATPDATTGGDAGGMPSLDGGAPPSLDGRWSSDCLPSPQADGSTQYFRLDFDLASARWDLDYVVHGDPACEVPLVTVSIAGPYTLERPSPTVAGAWEARFGFERKTIRPEVDGLRDFLNSLDGCGEAEFETGVAQDVFASGCPAFGQYPESVCPADYDLVKREGQVLRFGERPADNDMCTPEKRPTTLSPVENRRR